jgi:multicomponent Na+:H+ antiporter subunit D
MASPATMIADRSAAWVLDPVDLEQWLVLLPVAVPIAAGALLLMFRHRMRWHALLATGFMALTLAACAALLLRVMSFGPQAMTMGSWRPPYGITFEADATGALFALTATFVGLVCTLWSIVDITTTGRRYGFYSFLMVLMAGVNGVFLTGDIFNLYVWFEVFVISSFGLIILGSTRTQIDGATKYAVLNLVATTFFLVAVALLYGSFGTLNMADLTRVIAAKPTDAPLGTLATLLFAAFAMKAAAFPLNFWLPASYHTPRIVVAALFGAMLTKIGVYALLRVMAMILPLQLGALSGVVQWVAIATMMLGALGALAQDDLRRMVGFLVIAGVGSMLAGLAIGGVDALAGTIVYAVHSMLAMGAAYLLVGVVMARGGTASLARLGGLYTVQPFVAFLALLVFASIAGLPPGSGLWPKVMLVRASLAASSWGLAFALIASGFVMTLALFRVFALAFWRPAPAGMMSLPQDVPVRDMRLPVLCLSVLGGAMLWLGLMPETVIAAARLAAAGLVDPSAYIGAVPGLEALP